MLVPLLLFPTTVATPEMEVYGPGRLFVYGYAADCFDIAFAAAGAPPAHHSVSISAFTGFIQVYDGTTYRTTGGTWQSIQMEMDAATHVECTRDIAGPGYNVLVSGPGIAFAYRDAQ